MAANYLVLNDVPFEAPGSLDIWLPHDADPNQRVILAFLADPSDGADLDWHIELRHDWLEDEDVRSGLGFEGAFPGDHENFIIKQGHFTGGVIRGMWEVFSGSRLSPKGPPFRVPGHGLFHPGTEERLHDGGQYFQRIWFIANGDGSLRLSDVVLWYKLA